MSGTREMGNVYYWISSGMIGIKLVRINIGIDVCIGSSIGNLGDKPLSSDSHEVACAFEMLVVGCYKISV